MAAKTHGTCGTCTHWSSRRTWSWQHGICEDPNKHNGRTQTATRKDQGCTHWSKREGKRRG